MRLNQSGAEIFVPDGVAQAEALSRTTHLAIGAHQDDLEIMAYDGILQCFQQPDRWFTGVVVTDGAGSPTVYPGRTAPEMVGVRREEQKKAASIGAYAAQFLLDYPSGHVKSGGHPEVVADLVAILEATRPEVVYTHNLADKHDTHVGVTLRVLAALRALSVEARPKKVYGCEVWRDLDWMVDEDKVAFDVSERENLQMALLGVFDSQIAGGKRYDLATLGRRRAHATYFASHGVDTATGITFGMDLTALMENPELNPVAYVREHLDRFREDVTGRIERSL